MKPSKSIDTKIPFTRGRPSLNIAERNVPEIQKPDKKGEPLNTKPIKSKSNKRKKSLATSPEQPVISNIKSTK